MLPRRFQKCLGPVNSFTTEGCSETGGFRHLIDYVFGSQYIQRYKSYKANLFFQKCSNIYVDFRHTNKISQKVSGFIENCL